MPIYSTDMLKRSQDGDQGQKRVAETDLAIKVVVEPASPPEPTGVSDVSGVWQITLDPNEGPVLESFEGWRSHK